MRQPQNGQAPTETRVDLPRTPDESYRQAGAEITRKRSPLPLYIGLGLLVVVLIVGIAGALSGQFRRQLELSIVRQPTPYTQLYFSHPEALPGALKLNRENVFNFTVVNNESRPYRYTYVVTLQDSKSHLQVRTQALTVADGGSATQSVAVMPKDRKSKYLVTVTLEGLNQSIHFYGETP